jgi:carnosine N-methyltransferase
MIFPEKAICLKCRQELKQPEKSAAIVCENCGEEYMCVGDIPILLKDSARYVAKLFVQYSRYLRTQKLEIDRISEAARKDKKRANTLENIKGAFELNCAFMKTVQDELLPYVTIPELEKIVDEPDEIGYSDLFDYLKRDWCWLPEGEQEIQEIEKTLFNELRKGDTNLDNVLVIGAGAGRLAWDLSKTFGQVYAVDKSFLMASHFNAVQKEDLHFFEINSKNVLHNSDTVRALRASAVPPWEATADVKPKNSVAYFVADALHIPLPDHSLSVIVSVYFSDVVPMHSFVKEVKRLLKPGGVFIHYGPLDYHFDDWINRMAGNEIKALFSQNGFKIKTDDTVLGTHLMSSASMLSKQYKNWVFSASRLSIPAQVMNEDAILSIVGEINYETKGGLSSEKEELTEVSLLLPDGETYEGADSVLDILRIIDGQKTIREVVEMLETAYEFPDSEARQKVVHMIYELVQKGVLQTVKEEKVESTVYAASEALLN